MRRAFLVMAIFLIFAVSMMGCRRQVRPALADVSIKDIVDKIPATNIGLFYNITDSKAEFISTFKALSYRGFNVNLGYATEETIIGSLAYELIRLEKLGVELPVLKDIVIDAGWSIGIKKLFAHQEFVQGPSVTLKIKF